MVSHIGVLFFSENLNKSAQRTMIVLDPLRVVITNAEPSKVEEIESNPPIGNPYKVHPLEPRLLKLGPKLYRSRVHAWKEERARDLMATSLTSSACESKNIGTEVRSP